MTKERTPSQQYPEPAIYDILTTPGTMAEVDTFQRIEHAHLVGDRTKERMWFEPACGTGRYLRLAARRGYRSAGFDRNADMIDYARSRKWLANAKLFQADMIDFSEAALQVGIAAGSVDLAFNPVNTIRHLATDQDLISHLNQIALLLKPLGIYIVGISLVDYAWLEPEEDLWEGARGRCRVSQLVNYLPPEPGTMRSRQETVLSHFTVTTPGMVKHLDHRYQLRTYDNAQWTKVLARSSLRRIGSYDSMGMALGDRKLAYQLEVLGKP